MKVSIITATYNSEVTIEQTLQSVRGQSYNNIEHIIIDGKSKDNTVSICEKFPHVVSIISEQDKGIYDAMNKGLSKCTGDIIAILNSDDVYVDDNVISDIVSTFRNTDHNIVYGNTIAGDYNDQGDFSNISRVVKPGKFKRSKFLTGWMPSHVSVYAYRSVYNQYGAFSLNFKIGADYEWLLRTMFKNKVPSFYLDRDCVKFRLGGISTASLSNRLLTIEETKLAWKLNELNPWVITPFLKPVRGILDVIKTKLGINKMSA